MVNAIANEERARDLRRQIDGLNRDDENDIIFRDMSRTKDQTLLYRMSDGEPVWMDFDLAKVAINKMGPRGPQWTTNKEQAPKYVEGNVPCFLHEDAPEREVMMSLGLPPVCEQGKLKNAQAKRIHAIHCHKDEWAAYQEYLSDEAIRNDNEMRTKQLDATLALAGRAVGQPEPRIKSTPVVEPDAGDYDGNGVTNTLTCECGWMTVKGANSLAAHKRLHCPLKGTE